jgi:hypothetical protein
MSQQHDIQTTHEAPSSTQVRMLQRRIDDQRALMQRMIIQGGATQALEDILRQLYVTLQQARDQHGPN